LVSAAIINRPGSEATALSNHHRVAVSLTAIKAPFVLCHRAGDVAHRPFEGLVFPAPVLDCRRRTQRSLL
jgi:hypothetical protein